MGTGLSIARAAVSAAAIVFLLVFSTGCQFAQTVPTARLIQHQAVIDVAGLKEVETYDAVKVHVAAPQKWETLAPKRTTLFTDMQWRSPSKMTGVGVAHIRMPLPLPAGALVWLAKKEYSKGSGDGELLGQWTDSLGRPWFEARNARYHVRGYAVTKGFDAWVIYCGYKREQPPSAAELGLAARSLETIVPTPFANKVPQKPMAAGTPARSGGAGEF
ncbi:MAG TPA: hypothetical protein VER17_21230 [Tepidisphaeraceae bacterium]|nr:hypothetical protein [Tepidisphaeraceae bacterium]